MSEYIERGALLEEVESLAMTVTGMRDGRSVLKEVLTLYREAVLSEIKEAPTADVVEVVRCTDEIRKAMDVLNFYRNCHHSASSNTEEYDLADAINTILPRFYKCLDDAKAERSVDNG